MSEIAMPAAPSAADLQTPAAPKPTTAKDAAQQFEALLMAQILQSARESADTQDDDSENSTMLGLAEQQLSQLMAKGGGFGLAKIIVPGLSQGGPAPE